jgi:enoyl-CoA hydratase/carnithine racemase
MDKHLTLEIHQRVALLSLNQPRKRNALSDDLILALKNRLGQLSTDTTIRAVIIRGAGEKAFCSGYDLKALAIRGDRPDHSGPSNEHPLEPVAEAIAAYPFPVIAMVNGDAFGAGCELAVCCDVRVAADDIRMGVPPAKIGVVYPWTGLQRFVQAIGWNHTREMFFSGDVVSGPRLKEIGLVNHLIDRSELQAFTLALAQRIADNAPLSLMGIKKILNLLAGNTMPLTPDRIAEVDAIVIRALGSQDLIEGQVALREKRKPDFKGV